MNLIERANLVERLREVDLYNHYGKDLCSQAADEIENLRNQIENQDINGEMIRYHEHTIQRLEAEIQRLRAIAPAMMKTLEMGCDQWEEGWNYAVEEFIEQVGESK
jgi:hypothetical protein